ncbi:hypothetical protein DSM19430T_06480 [Desulfovibrio psychrotolerans]|uniref:Uncharacterized protein n=1 Tax=Desulfovibrio psychrotolerans TaxID=415242 RepID=A0A7J0BSG7_9BACT|nr:hypothetical protein DSM19430T_06480 [Desulfovibrio psychrotolerans]
MTMLADLEDRGCHLFLDDTGQMHLEASASVSPEVWDGVVFFVRQNRQAILAELQKSSGENDWVGLGIMLPHPSPRGGICEPAELVRHVSGRYCLQRIDGVLLTVPQQWAIERAADSHPG